MKKKVFLSGNYQAVLSYVFLLFPYLIFLDNELRGAWWVFIAIVASYMLYAIVFHRFIRVIVIKDERIKALPSLTPIDQIQYNVDEPLRDIITATYAFAQGNSRGESIYWGWDIPSLKLDLKGGREERVMLCGYTKKRIDSIEKTMKEGNPNIVFNNQSNILFKK